LLTDNQGKLLWVAPNAETPSPRGKTRRDENTKQLPPPKNAEDKAKPQS
jgi:hypothetical protein